VNESEARDVNDLLTWLLNPQTGDAEAAEAAVAMLAAAAYRVLGRGWTGAAAALEWEQTGAVFRSAADPDPDDDDGWRSFQVGAFRLGVQVARGVCPTTGKPSGVRYLTLAFSRSRRGA
jgi:hypothetical protein